MKKIIISNEVTLSQGVSPEEARPIYKKIVECLKAGENVVISFEGMKLMTTAFLNVVIGELYKDYTSEQLNSKLKFEGINQDIAIRIKKVTDNAKSFYKNQPRYNKIVEESINGKNI